MPFDVRVDEKATASDADKGNAVIDAKQEEEDKSSVASDDEDKVADEEIVGKPSITVTSVEETRRYTTDLPPSELNICCICLERQIETVLTCFHAYCNTCIDGWK